MGTITGYEPLPIESDFSLVLGGPLYQFLRRAHLTGDALQLLNRRVAVLVSLAWAPLLLLAIAEGNVWGGTLQLTFLRDVEMHVRFLVSLPLLILAERVVHERMRPVVQEFLARGLVPDAARERFDAALAAAMRLRNSVAAEVLLLAFVYGVGVLFFWRTQIAMDVASWYGTAVNGVLQPSLAGWWLGLVSLPLFQFLLLRWYFRLFIWARFQWQVSRIGLMPMPAHPDRCGGFSFLSAVCSAFEPVLLAQGALLAGLITNRVFYSGASLADFKIELGGLVGVMLFAVLGPMLVFAPTLAAARRAGIREYGLFAQRYAREFDAKWLRGGAGPDEPLVGSGDIQSLADLSGVFAVVKEMQVIPFTLRTVVQLAVITLLPVAPLLLTMIPLEELMARLLKVVF
jgi:hypothetical protein